MIGRILFHLCNEAFKAWDTSFAAKKDIPIIQVAGSGDSTVAGFPQAFISESDQELLIKANAVLVVQCPRKDDRSCQYGQLHKLYMINYCKEV